MSRDAILAKVRAALGPATHDAARKRAVEERLGTPPRHLIPERATKLGAELVSDFKARLRAQAATVIEVDAAEAIPEAIARYLAENERPPRVRMGADAFLASLPWSKTKVLQCQNGRAQPDDATGLSHALAGIAETGTLVLASGADNPTTLAFLPETHIVTISEDSIVGPMEDAFDIVRRHFGHHAMPRTLNLISGPSRTGDIGGRIVLGAHGPRWLCVIVVTAKT